MFILGTSSVLVFSTNSNNIDLIGPVPQTLSIGFRSFGFVGVIVSVAILLLAARAISVTSIFFSGTSRLPMVAGWDHLLPAWFTRLHARWKTPANSILFVGAITLVFALACPIGVGPQEAFQVADNAAGIFYGIAYLVFFAIPLVGAAKIRGGAPIWVRIAAADLYATHGQNAKRAAELYREVQRIPKLMSGQDVYVSNKLVDLYLGPLKEPGRVDGQPAS